QVEITTKEEKKDQYAKGNSPDITTTFTYLTNAKPEEVATYYNSTLPTLGWYFYDFLNPDLGPVDSQAGSITSEAGMFFAAGHRGSPGATHVSMKLTIDAQLVKTGLVRVKLKVKQHEGPIPRF